MSNSGGSVLIGTPVHRLGAYVLDKFLSNLKQIQDGYPPSEIILATAEKDYTQELQSRLSTAGLRGKVIAYEVEKPYYARDRIWNITSGREVIRKHLLSKTGADYLLFLDSDMTYDLKVTEIMLRELKGYDLVFSGYPLKNGLLGLAGCGCLMMNRRILEKIKFRCREIGRGEIIFEDNMLEMDAFKAGGKIKKGFFLNIRHYLSPDEYESVAPRQVGLFRKASNNAWLRYFLIKLSVIIKLNVPWKIKLLLKR